MEKKIERFLNKLHTADVADVISHLEVKEEQKILNMLKPCGTAEVLNEIDPAIATDPFVTTANDITGMLIYFSLALGLMKYLV